MICLSQQLEDFAHSAFRAAILGNAGSQRIGHPGKVNMQSFYELLNLKDHQIDMIQRPKVAATSPCSSRATAARWCASRRTR